MSLSARHPSVARVTLTDSPDLYELFESYLDWELIEVDLLAHEVLLCKPEPDRPVDQRDCVILAGMLARIWLQSTKR